MVTVILKKCNWLFLNFFYCCKVMYAYERMFVLLKQLVICKTKLPNLVQISKC